MQYAIGAVARLTGVAVDTLRAWERRYGVVTPSRAGGRRLYSEEDVRRLTLLRKAVEQGHAISQVAQLPVETLSQLSTRAPAAPEHPAPEPVGWSRLLACVREYDYAKTNEELGRLALLMTPADLVHRVILPVMRRAGEEWEHGSLQAAQEHLLSACVRNLLGSLLRLHSGTPAAPRLVMTTPAGELHEFGILAAALLAAGQGFQVAYLGPNLPASEILPACERFGPRALVLGVTQGRSAETGTEIARLADELSPAAEVWVGGAGAPQVVENGSRDKVVLVGDLADFERHLARLRAESHRRG